MVSLTQISELMRELWRRKLRTFLSVFGIFWGTVSVVMLLALGSGYYNKSVESLSSLENHAMLFFAGVTQFSFHGYPAGSGVKIPISALMQMEKQLTDIQYLSPIVSLNPQDIKYKNKHIGHRISGANWSYSLIWALEKQIEGRFFSKDEIKEASYEVVLGHGVEKILSPHQSLIGEFIQIDGIPFRVIGIVRAQQTGRVGWLSQKVFIPYTTAIMLGGSKLTQRFIVLPSHTANLDRIKQMIRIYLGIKFHFNPKDTRALNSPDLSGLVRKISMVFLTIKFFLGFCGLLTLTVGAISVANMMFLIVTERTHEIGLRKALGAKNKDIASTVLVETTLIVFIGGALGFIFSVFLVQLFHFIPMPKWIGTPVIDLGTACITWVVLFALALISALFPARRAMKMDPAEALSK